MITRVWGRINSKELEFTPIPEQPGYWEGFGPKNEIYQNIEIWAENDLGARGHLECTIVIREWTDTIARLLLAPYKVRLLRDDELCRCL